MKRLGVRPGSVVADIGAGDGRDSWVLAEIVGPSGVVYSEEISEKKIATIRKGVESRKLTQVKVVLGRVDTPCLPSNAIDVAYMRYVYHHLTKPREVLRAIWRSLKPGGRLVVVDRHRGTLRDWVPREKRGPKHFWIAETTVVREAREEGFAFVGCFEDCWPANDQFVLVFQRPKSLAEPGRDPDPFFPLDLSLAERLLKPVRGVYRRPAFIALGQARQLIAPILHCSAHPGIDIVLEEWATRKDERPPVPAGVSLPSMLTENGDPHLPDQPIDVVFFLDSYHLLFHQKMLVEKLRERLTPNGCVYILDRKSDKPMPRRECSHRRRVLPELAKSEMETAGFHLWAEGPAPAADRFLLVFRKTAPDQLSLDEEPFLAGPKIAGPPGRWLSENYWRLRGVRTCQGECLLFERSRQSLTGGITAANNQTAVVEIPEQQVTLCFQRANDGYVVTGFRRIGRRSDSTVNSGRGKSRRGEGRSGARKLR